MKAACNLDAPKGGSMTDTERLDWLEETHFDLVYTTSLMRPRWCVGAEEAYFEVEGKTPREAIDSAMGMAAAAPKAGKGDAS